MTGTITTIQRMSIHDGPGLRTVVFMKGCNMRCKWCHNPETWSRRRQLQYISEKCIRCFTCTQVCPNGVLSPVESELGIDFSKCKACGTCAEVCCTGALSLVGKEVDEEGLWNEVKKDVPFFRNSDGGVTVSGGEPLLQKDFVKAFLGLCKENGLHTAIESNLSQDWASIEELFPVTDLWMCDLKIFDAEKHKEWTGIDNRATIGNIRRLGASGQKMLVRTPVIPGVNDTEEEIENICKVLEPFAKNLSYELLGFHTLGFSKFESMGMGNELEGKEALPTARLEELKQILKKYNF